MALESASQYVICPSHIEAERVGMSEDRRHVLNRWHVSSHCVAKAWRRNIQRDTGIRFLWLVTDFQCVRCNDNKTRGIIPCPATLGSGRWGAPLCCHPEATRPGHGRHLPVPGAGWGGAACGKSASINTAARELEMTPSLNSHAKKKAASRLMGLSMLFILSPPR